MKRFATLFLVTAWIIYLTAQSRIIGGIFLMLGGAYYGLDSIEKGWGYGKGADDSKC